MLLGEYRHSIDEKGRLIIPARLRDDLGDSFVICNGLEGCLFVYSQDEWNKFVAELESLPRMNKDARIFKRYFFGSASEGTFDKQGRVLIPPALRKAANLEKDVVLVGVQDRVEIWNGDLWDDSKDISEEELDAIAERMESIGIRI
ncbi:MAG: division/cell wall cluster transcriptional repressor MraZ [Schaedlerella sp.]|nr:division/cell wall cluster transcriptional repressor MraZ [Lachnospiraceae bacterium]MDY4202808.1 division/cell wall cluster transcriptional repressor MraZ [Schaedlerella sp.]